MQKRIAIIAAIVLVVVVAGGVAVYQYSKMAAVGREYHPQGRVAAKLPVVPPVETPLKATHRAVIKTAKGTIEFEMYGEDAPKTVANFVGLTTKGFYNGLTFHRVETGAGFQLIQGGDPKGDGTGNADKTIEREISPKLKHWEGAVAMARGGDPNSASCQFYICNVAIPSLDNEYAVFGKVTKGLDVAKKITKGDKMTEVKILD